MEVLYQNLLTIELNQVIMWAIGGLLIYLAIAKDMEPTLLLPMGFGAILVNLPNSGLLEKIAYLIVPENKEAEKVVELDQRLLATPTIALQQCGQLAIKMAEETVEGFRLSLQCLSDYADSTAQRIREIENSTDHYEDILGTYLTQIARCQISEDDSSEVSRLLKTIGDLERISDHSVNVLESVEEMQEKKIAFSAEGKEEMDVLCAALAEILEVTMDAFRTDDLEKVYTVEPLEQVIDRLRSELRNRHIARLKKGECSVEAGFVWSDLLTDLERTSDHCSNIALSILDAHAHNMNAHQSLRAMQEGNPVFVEKLENCSRKYVLPRG